MTQLRAALPLAAKPQPVCERQVVSLCPERPQSLGERKRGPGPGPLGPLGPPLGLLRTSRLRETLSGPELSASAMKLMMDASQEAYNELEVLRQKLGRSLGPLETGSGSLPN